MKFNKLFAMAIFVLFTKIAFASAPSLSINPADYSYTQSVTAVLVENCVELNNPNNILIAYVKGQLRGYVNSSTLVGSRQMAFLSIYSNVPSGDTVTFKIYNADSDQLIDVKTIIIYKDDAIVGSPSTPIEMHTNNRPTNLQLSTLLIPETYVGDPSISLISAIDLDVTNTLTYALVSGVNSTDNSYFKVVGNELHYNGVVNTGIKDTFKIRLNVADNFGCTTEKEFALIVDKVNDAPTGLLLSDSTFNENKNNPVIGYFSTEDPDLVDQFTYTLVSGLGDTDNASFSIVDSTIIFNGSANFEVKNQYTVRIKVTDIGNLTYEKSFNLYVEDMNDNPTNIILSTNKVFENSPLNVFVAKLSTIDEDAVDRYTYTFANIGTNDNANFKIVNDTLKANKVFDFETKDVYNIYLTSTDSLGLFVTKAYSIYIQDTTDAPTDINLDNNIITENLPSKTFIGLLNTVDSNKPPVIYTYSLVSGVGSTNNASFVISNDSLYTNEMFDYETKTTYTIRVRTTLQNNMFTEKSFVINIKDVISTNITLSNNKVYENEPATQFVAKISTVSLDNTDQYTYTFGNVGTNDNTTFSISNDSIYATKVFNFEDKASYVIYVTSTSKSGLAITRPFTINILDSLDVPTDINLDNNIITENSTVKTFISKLSTVDINTQPVAYTYSLVAGVGSTNNSSFVISNDSLYSNEMFDYETKTSYTIRVKSLLINNMFTEKSFVINIKDVISTNITLSNNKVYENEPATQFVAKISTVSLDNTDQYTYTFGNVGTNDNTTFSISNDSIYATKVFNFEDKASYVIYVTSTSKSGLAITRPFTINILDSLDVPTDINLDNNIITENSTVKTFISKLSTVDINTQPVAYTYSLVAGVGSTNNSSFVISNDSLYSNEMFDYETKTSYTIRVKSLLINNMFTEKSFVINIKDQNEKPFLLSISKDSVNENTKDSTFIGILSTQDFDVNDKFNYTLISSNSNSDISNFAINGSALFLIKTLNFETQNVYNLIIRTTDSGGLTLDSTIVIYVKDINEKPILIFQEYEISELAAKDSVIGTVTFTDQDLNQNYKFELSDTTLPFSIDTSGVLRLNGSIDYESKNEFEVWVRIIDNGNPNLVDSIKQIIHIIDEIELSELPSANLVTPNDDGYNDVWKINNVHLYKDFSLDIVDEYGQSVYAVPNNYNNDWDAKISGKSLPSGLYYYVFKNNMKGKLFKGNITVIK